jgi:hypothetical protein
VNLPAGAFAATVTKPRSGGDGGDAEEVEVVQLPPLGEVRKKILNKLYGGGDIPVAGVIVHCFSGMTACVAAACSLHVGLGLPRLFVDSWSQYEKAHETALVDERIAAQGSLVQLSKRFPNARVVNDDDKILVQGAEAPVTVAEFCARCTDDEPGYIPGLLSHHTLVHGADVGRDPSRPLPKPLAAAVRKLHPGEVAVVKTKFVVVEISVVKPDDPPPPAK